MTRQKTYKPLGLKYGALTLALCSLAFFSPQSAWADCAAPVSPEGGLNYDAVNDKYLLCDGTNWLDITNGSSVSVTLSDLLAATATNTIANANFAQVWNWDTLTTQTAMTMGSTSITSGKVLDINSSATGFSGTMADLTLSGNNALNTGTVLKSSVTGALSNAVPLMVTNLGVGHSFRVNDATGDADASPFIIDAAGQVGIGTDAPSAPLHVEYVGGTDTTNPATMRLINSTAQGSAEMTMGEGADGASGSMSIRYYSDAAGTINEMQIGEGWDGTFAPRVYIDRDAAMLGIGASPSDPLYVSTAGGNMYFTTTGRLGIGTSAPTAPLHVADSVVAGTVDLRIQNTTSQNSSRIVFEEGSQGDNFAIKYNTDGGTQNNLEFIGSGAGVIMSIERDSGDVGIGATSPDANLEIFQPAGAYPRLRLSSGDITLPDYSGSASIGDVASSATIGEIRGNLGGNGNDTRGGLLIQGFNDSGVGDWEPLYLVGTHASTTPTAAAVVVAGQKWNGGTNRDPLSGSEPVFDVRNNYHNSTTTLFRVEAGGNVGIGTISPDTMLHADGTLKIANGSETCTVAGDGGMIRYNTNTIDYCNGTAWTTLAATGGTTALSGLTAATATNTIANANFAQAWNWDTLTTETAMTLGSTSITSGNILDISSSATGFTGTMADLTLSGSNALNTGTVLKSSVTGALSNAVPMMVTNLGTGTSFRVNDETGDADATPFVIDATGQVGIGTASPAHDLYIKSSSTPTIALEQLGTDVNGSGAVNWYDETAQKWSMGVFSDSYTTASLQNAWVVAQITNKSDTAVNKVRMVIDDDGKVGIGTTTPASPSSGNIDILHISNANDTGVIISTEAGGNFGPALSLYHNTADGGRNWKLFSTGSGNTTNGAGKFNIRDKTANANRFTIDATGKTGIGTVSPATLLHISEDNATANAVTNVARLTHTTSGAPVTGIGVGIDFEAETSASNNEIGASIQALTTDVTATAEDFDLTFSTMAAGAAATEKMRIVSTGEVGIGSTSPDTLLDIAGTLKIADGSETCTVAGDGGMIRYNTNTIDYCNGTAWITLASTGSAGVFEVTGGAGSEVVSEVDATAPYATADFVFGSPQLADDADVNHDSRMFFDKSKSAFRAGVVDGTQWDNANVGSFSVAIGQNNTASGAASAVFGQHSAATNTGSVAFGSYSAARGFNSFAQGNGSNATGQFSVAMGKSVFAGNGTAGNGLGDGSFAFGLFDDAVTISVSPQVTGIQSFGIFMDDQDGLVMSADNTMGLLGGSMVIDPAVPATNLSADTALDVIGTLKIADGSETCTVAGDGGMVRYNTNTIDFCNGTAWTTLAANGSMAINDLSDAITDYATDNTIFMGQGAGASNTTGDFAVALGINALNANTAGRYNTAIGYNTLAANTGAGADWNTAVGYNVLAANTSGDTNIAVGAESLQANTTGDRNVAVGWALAANTTASSNTAIGVDTLNANTIGTSNTAIGADALTNNQSNSWNVAIGSSALKSSTSDNNTAVGANALELVTTGGNNTAVGGLAGGTITTGSDNIIIGYNISTPLATTSNHLNIGDTIYADLSTDSVGIGVVSPSTALDVIGTLQIADGSETCTVAGDGGMIRYNTNTIDYCNGTAWTTLASTGSSGVFEVTGGAGSEVVSSIDANVPYTTADFVFGSPQLADDTDANHDSRMWFDKSKSAFRAGRVTGAQWDDANVGTNSVAIGFDVQANGGQSVAMGAYNTASGLYSTAMGSYATASGTNSFAMGNSTQALSTSSVALGKGTSVTGTGTNSFAFGLGNPAGAIPQVSGSSSFGIFMGDQSGVDLTDANTVSIMGASGGVGIGTVSPTVELDVVGSASINDGNGNVFIEGGNSTTTGTDNVAVGNGTMDALTTGFENTALGANALTNLTWGVSNVAVGIRALDTNVGGNRNTAVGTDALAAVTTGGENNIGLGRAAGNTVTTGDYNILIGDGVNPPTATTDNYLNIGNTIYGDLTNDYVGIGNSSPSVALDVTGDIEYTGTITDVSDRRLKDNIEPLIKTGSLLKRLEKIDTYSFTMKGDKKGRKEFGVMAQELEKIFPELVHTANDEMGTKSVNYVGLIAPMIEATKELGSENNTLKSELLELKTAQVDTTKTLANLSKKVALLNKVTSNNVGKASMESWLFLLFGLVGGMGLTFAFQRSRQEE